MATPFCVLLLIMLSYLAILNESGSAKAHTVKGIKPLDCMANDLGKLFILIFENLQFL
jgi:hypothetical protein